MGIESTIDEVFDHTYAELTPELVEQKAEAIKFFGKGNK